MAAPLSCVILTYNEGKNIRRCLESLSGWVKEIFIVDSFSNDKTIEIASNFTGNIIQRPFKTHVQQWNWAFSNLHFSCEWGLALDADQSISDALKKEIEFIFARGIPKEINGYYIKRRQFFQGRWLRFGGYYPKYMLKLFKIEKVCCDEKELVDNRFYVEGKAGRLKYDFIEDNRNEDDIIFWLNKHLRYAQLKAEEIFNYRQDKRSWLVRPSLFGTPDQKILYLTDIYYCLPLYVRPLLYFIWRYFFLLGFLDGPKGFIFHFFQGLWYRQVIDVKIEELKKQQSTYGKV